MPEQEPTGAEAADANREDLRLMERTGAGDVAAFEQLVERHQALVAGTVARMLGNNAEVEDIAQQVFLRVWKSAKRYVPRARFTTWLLKITRNLVFNEMRRRKRRIVSTTTPEPSLEEVPLPDEEGVTPDAALLENELKREIAAAIQELPASQRMAMILRRYEDLSYEEIAEVLDQTVPGVKSLLFRARTQLRERLKGYLAE